MTEELYGPDANGLEGALSELRAPVPSAALRGRVLAMAPVAARPGRPALRFAFAASAAALLATAAALAPLFEGSGGGAPRLVASIPPPGPPDPDEIALVDMEETPEPAASPLLIAEIPLD